MTWTWANFVEADYRFRNDDGSESGATWIAAAHTPATIDVDDPFRVRFLIQQTVSGTNRDNDAAPLLQYSTNGSDWYSVGATTPVQYSASGYVSDATSTTQQLGSGTFVGGYFDTNQAVASINMDNVEETEWEYCLTIDSAQVSDNDTIYLRTSWSVGPDSRTYACSLTVNEAASPVLAQNAFRIRHDDGSESAASWVAAINTSATLRVADSQNYRVRFQVEETAGAAASSQQYRVYISVNSGGYKQLVSDITLDGIAFTATTQYADGDDCTQQLGSGTFLTNNDGCLDYDYQTNAIVIPASTQTEIEVCLAFHSSYFSDGDTFDFRIYPAGSPLDSYTQTPRITVYAAHVLAGTVAGTGTSTGDLTVVSGGTTHELAGTVAGTGTATGDLVQSYIEQLAFRFRNDDGSESTATWAADLNTDYTLTADGLIRLRIAIWNSGGATWPATQVVVLRSYNGGGYTRVGIATSLIAIGNGLLNPGGWTTQQITSGDFDVNNSGQIDDSVYKGTPTTDAGEKWELEITLDVDWDSLSNLDYFDFRVYHDEFDETAFPVYTETPRLTIQKSVTHTLEGSVAGTGSAAGTLTLEQAVAGSVAGTGSTAGDLRVTRKLDGTIAGSGTAVGDLEATRELVGTIAGTGSATGDLDLVEPTWALEGSVAGVGSASADLRVTRALAGTADGLGSLVGAVTLDVALAGTVTGTGTAIGDLDLLTGAISLEGSVAGTGAAVGDLGPVRGLAGAADGVGTTTADLRVTRGLAGTVDASGATTGSLVLTQAVAGTVAGVGSAIGDLDLITGAITLEGSIAGLGTTTGDVRAIRGLAGSVSATGSADGTLVLDHPLAGSVSGAGTVTGDLTLVTETLQLEGTIVGTGTTTGDLDVDHATWSLEGTAVGAGSVVADLSPIRGLAGTIDGLATVLGTLEQILALVGSVSGTGTATGTLIGTFNLAGSISATGSATGDLDVWAEIPLAGDVTAFGSAVGDLSVRGFWRDLTTREADVSSCLRASADLRTISAKISDAIRVDLENLFRR